MILETFRKKILIWSLYKCGKLILNFILTYGSLRRPYVKMSLFLHADLLRGPYEKNQFLNQKLTIARRGISLFRLANVLLLIESSPSTTKSDITKLLTLKFRNVNMFY